MQPQGVSPYNQKSNLMLIQQEKHLQNIFD